MRGRFFITCILFALSALSFQKVFSQPISQYLFGANAWMPDTIGDVNNCASGHCIHYGKLHNNWAKVADSKASLVRYGGIAVDEDMPTHYQYIRMIDSIRSKGMEPMLQVPFNNYYYTAQQAAAIVQYINGAMGRHVKYWIIANEPNQSYAYSTSGQIAAYFKSFASAMKAADPTISIVGPETASFKQAILNGLTNPGGPDDITGRDANGNFYLDVYTFHTYPFGTGTNSSRSALISNLTAPGNFYDNLVYLKNRLAVCNSYHGRTGNNILSMGVTEANVNYTNSATDNLYGYGTYSFLGAQFVAEIYGLGMKNGVSFINLWSVIEGNSISSNCGYIDKYTGNKTPTYYHFQMMAENFKGNNVNCTLNQANVKSFASSDSQQVCVMIMNEELTTNHSYTVRLNNNAIANSSTLKVNADANIQAEYTDLIQNQSTILLVFDKLGNLVRKCEYTLANQAVNNLPPACTPYITTSASAPSHTGGLDINMYPNPTTGFLTIELEQAKQQSKYSIDILNLVGQVVYRREDSFRNGKEEIVLDAGLSRGVYIVCVREGESFVAKRIVLQ